MKRVLVYGAGENVLGGIETYLFAMQESLKGKIIFDYVIEGTKSIHEEKINELGGKCYYVAPKKKVFKNLKDWKNLLKAYKEQGDTIYFNLYSFAWGFPISMALKQKYKVLVHAHNNMLHNCGFLQKTLHKMSVSKFQKKSIIRLTNSSLSADFFFKNKANEATLIYNGIDVDKFAFDANKRNEIRKQLDIKDDEHLYGFSGRISYQKNPLFLIDIFKEVSNKDPKSRFVMCGDGDLLDNAKEKAKELGLNIIFTGSVLNMSDYYQAFDLFILPSRFEGLGIVLIEAQCSGLKCITSKDVVPELANVSGSINYVSLGESSSYWAKICVKNITNINERNQAKQIIKDSAFNSANASLSLEGLLNG